MSSPERPSSPHQTSVTHRALAHPTRAQIVALLRNREMSPSELARETGDVVGVTAYHVRVLAEAGLAELVRTQPKRGAVQHIYRGTGAGPVGETLMLSERAANALVAELHDAVDRARQEPGEVSVVVIAHHV
jgi:DNA-binding transcriptional ArsR family regulator